MTEDEKIIELFFRRSEQALRALDGRYGKVFYSLAYNILNNRQDAEECVNDAYLAAWNAIPPAKPESLQAYLCKIVRNLSLKRYYRNRAAKRYSAYMIAMEELEPYLPGPDTVESAVETKELAAAVERFLGTLSEENRVIFLRRYWFSDPYAEIAKRVGLSEKTVSVRLVRIRRQLKKYLEERQVGL